MFRPRSRRGRLAFTTTALLAGCSTIGPPATRPLTPWEVAGSTSSVVMLRVVPGEGEARRPASDLLAEAEAWQPESARPRNLSFNTPAFQPSEAAGAEGWMAVALPPGWQFLRLRAVAGGPVQDLSLTVPASRSTIYAGSFRRDCGGGPCRLVPIPAEEAAARAAVPEARRAGFPFLALPAEPYPPRLAGTGLPPPAAPAIRADATVWLSSVDWLRLLGEGAEIPEPPAGQFSSDLEGVMMGGGLLLAGAVFLAVLIPIALVALIVQSERQRHETVPSETERQRAEALQARAEAARAAWSPCEATIGAALAPDTVVQRLEAAMPRPRTARQASPWQASITRVVLRQCGEGPGTFGVEVATRWTGTRPGEVVPAYAAGFVRPVQGAMPDNRLRWSDPAPWEVPVAPAAACRPLASWCADGGAALQDEVLRAVTGARDTIAATR